MIDYLERLFSVEMKEAEGHHVESGSLLPEVAQWGGPEGGILPEGTAQFWQQEIKARLDSALDVESAQRESVSIRRPAEGETGESLEHRLRRDSRRYDSGFFLY